MKIAFITSSLEPGKDGIGDYTLSLAAALRGLGHEVLVVGLNDYWLPDQNAMVSGVNSSAVLLERCPHGISYADRIAHVALKLQDFGAEWASFQMSCYAYHRKGIIFGLNRHLPRLARAVDNWHMMFHELWIGFNRGAPLKHRLVGMLQRMSIKGGVRALRPKLFHTSTPLFRALLKTIGINASILPLPGNIPVNPDPGTDWFLGLLSAGGMCVTTENRSAHLVAGFFGAIYPSQNLNPFFASLKVAASNVGRKAWVFSAGRLGGGEVIWDALSSQHPEIQFIKLGELSFERASQYLQNLDCGIAATPWLLIAKSGAAAAMLDHGVPVLVPRNDYMPRESFQIQEPVDPFLILADGVVSEQFLACLPRRPPLHSSNALASRFAQSLKGAGHDFGFVSA